MSGYIKEAYALPENKAYLKRLISDNIKDFTEDEIGTLDKEDWPNFPKDDLKKIGNLEIIGFSQNKTKGIRGINYSYRYLLNGESHDWTKLLKELDSHFTFHKFLWPLFAEVLSSSYTLREHSWRNYPSEADKYHLGHKWEILRIPNQQEVLEVLKALYNTKDSSKNQLDFPDSFWEEDTNIYEYQMYFFTGLADFISKYQGVLIEWKSSQSGANEIDGADVKHLATQGLKWNGITPYVANAMIKSALVTSLKSIGQLINYNGKINDDELKIISDIIKNSAIVIKAAIEANNDKLNSISEGAINLLNQVWSLIPFSQSVKLFAKLSKIIIDSYFKSILIIGESYSNPENMKTEIAKYFSNMIDKLEDKDKGKIISADNYIMLSNRFKTYIA